VTEFCTTVKSNRSANKEKLDQTKLYLLYLFLDRKNLQKLQECDLINT
jgi:hypothetical protein